VSIVAAYNAPVPEKSCAFDEQNSQRRQEIEVDGSEVYGAHD
jgi:hypothetical protein